MQEGLILEFMRDVTSVPKEATPDPLSLQLPGCPLAAFYQSL